MTRATVNIATLYSSAQCVLSVVGSVGVILLFAGIPQLIYSPHVSIANLMTFLLGAILITTMVAGNSFLNYKYRKFTRSAQVRQRDVNSSEAASSRIDADDKPPSYEAILSSDGLPPDYFSILSEKPPRYEDVAQGIYTVGTISPAVPLDLASTTDTSGITTCGSDPLTPVGLESLPNVFQSKGTIVSSSSSSSRAVVAEVAATSKPKKEEEQVPTTSVVPQVTIGYDNDAYARREETSSSSSSPSSSSSGSSPTTDLRESES